MTFGGKVLAFNRWLKTSEPSLPRGIGLLNPFRDAYVFSLSRAFYNKYYDDNEPRYFLFGINPGRFGAGLTGIPFTDPLNLETRCRIPNALSKQPELSSDFIYRMIERMGGPETFYRHFFITSVCPLGFVKDGVNLNYYDDPKLMKRVRPYIIESVDKQLKFGGRREVAFIIGEGKNLSFFEDLNREQGWFERLVALPHPRFIMQYKRKQLDEYLERYLILLSNVLP